MADLLLAVIDLLRHVRMVERVEVEVDILVVQVVLVIGVHFHQQVIQSELEEVAIFIQLLRMPHLLQRPLLIQKLLQRKQIQIMSLE